MATTKDDVERSFLTRALRTRARRSGEMVTLLLHSGMSTLTSVALMLVGRSEGRTRWS